MLPTQTVFALKQDFKRLPEVKGKISFSRLEKSHLNHEVVLFFDLADAPHDFLVTRVHGPRVHTQGWCREVQIHPAVFIAPPTAVSGPITQAVLIYI